MKVLMLVFNVVERGTFFRAYAFAREFVKKGHVVTLIATSTSQRFVHKTYFQEGIRVIETPDWCFGAMRSGWDLYNTLYRMALINPKEYDVAHLFETRPVNLLPALMMRRAGVPLVFDWSDWFGKGGSVEERPNALIRFFLRPVETFFEERFRDKANATTVICTTLRERAIELGVDPGSVTIIPNGFDMPSWQRTQKQDVRRKLGIDKTDFVIGYVGSIFPMDARLMADAFDLVVSKIPNARLLHVGHSNYSIKDKVRNQGKVKEIRELSQDEMEQYLDACDICWLILNDTNANYGRLPMKFSNYLAAGKPIVSTDVGDLAKVITETNVGIVSKNDAIEICEAVCRLFSNRSLLNKMGREGFALSQNFEESWSSRANQILRIYNEQSRPLSSGKIKIE